MIERIGVKFEADTKSTDQAFTKIDKKKKEYESKKTKLQIKVEADISRYKDQLNALKSQKREAVKLKLDTSEVDRKLEEIKRKISSLKTFSRLDISKSSDSLLNQVESLKKAERLQKTLEKTASGYNRVARDSKNELQGLIKVNKENIDLLSKGEIEYSKFTSQLDKTNRSFERLQKTASDKGMEVQFGTIVKGYAAYKAVEIGITAIEAVTIGAVENAIKLEESFAKVNKTLKDESVFPLIKLQLKDLSEQIPVTVEELAEIAAIGAQTGVSDKNLRTFTETVARLGSTTNISTEDAALGFTKLQNALGLTENEFDNMASSIVGLGNNFSTQEDEILNYGQRLASAGRLAKMSAGDILGFGTAAASVGVTAEAGASSISYLFNEITTATVEGGLKLQQFSQLAGMSSKEFKKAYEMDSANTIIKVLEGVNKQGKKAIPIIHQLTGKETRRTSILASLAQEYESLHEAVKMGNEEYTKNTALLDESEKRFDTLGSKITLLQNKWSNFLAKSGEKMFPKVEDAIDVLGSNGLLGTITALSDAFNIFIGGVTTLFNLGHNIGIGVAGVLQSIILLAGKAGLAVTGLFTDVSDAQRKFEERNDRVFQDLKKSWDQNSKDIEKAGKSTGESLESITTILTKGYQDDTKILAEETKKQKTLLDRKVQDYKKAIDEIRKTKTPYSLLGQMDATVAEKEYDEFQKKKIKDIQELERQLKKLEGLDTSLTYSEEDIEKIVNQKDIDSILRLEKLQFERIQSLKELSREQKDYTLETMKLNNEIEDSISSLNSEYRDYSNTIKDLQDQISKSNNQTEIKNLQEQVKITEELQALKKQEIDIQEQIKREKYDIRIQELKDKQSILEKQASIEESAGNKVTSELKKRQAQALSGQIQALKKEQFLAEERSQTLIDIKRREKEAILAEKEDELNKLEALEKRATQRVQFQRDFNREFLGGNAFAAYREALTGSRGVVTTDLQTTGKTVNNSFGDIVITDDTKLESFKRQLSSL